MSADFIRPCRVNSTIHLTVRLENSSAFYWSIFILTTEEVVGAMDTRHAVHLQIFNGQDSWPKGTPDSIFIFQHKYLYSLMKGNF